MDDDKGVVPGDHQQAMPFTAEEHEFVTGYMGGDALVVTREADRLLVRVSLVARAVLSFICLLFALLTTLAAIAATQEHALIALINGVLALALWSSVLRPLTNNERFVIDLSSGRISLWTRRWGPPIFEVMPEQLLAVDTKGYRRTGRKRSIDLLVYVAVLTMKTGESLFLCASSNKEKIDGIAADLRRCLRPGVISRASREGGDKL